MRPRSKRISTRSIRARPAARRANPGTLFFAALALALNIVALLVLLVPGVNAVIFLVVNAYLLGRGYFELAALRYSRIEDVARIRRANELQIFLAGLFVAAARRCAAPQSADTALRRLADGAPSQ